MASRSYGEERERIVSICAEIFARKGYHNTGLAELTKATGLGRGGFYHYIESKETLLFDIIKSTIDPLNDEAEKLRQLDLSVVEHLRALARGLMTNGASHRGEWTIFFREFLSLTGPRRAEILEARNRYEGFWREVLVRGVAEESFTQDPSVAVKAILGTFNHTYIWFDPTGPLSPTELADRFLQLFLDGLRPRA